MYWTLLLNVFCCPLTICQKTSWACLAKPICFPVSENSDFPPLYLILHVDGKHSQIISVFIFQDTLSFELFGWWWILKTCQLARQRWTAFFVAPQHSSKLRLLFFSDVPTEMVMQTSNLMLDSPVFISC